MGIWLEDWRGLPIEVTALSAVVNLLHGAVSPKPAAASPWACDADRLK